MSKLVAAHMDRVAPSATVAIADKATRLRQRGIEVIDFSAGRASEPTPAFVCRWASEALERGDTHQTPAQGTRNYLEACAAKLARDNDLIVDPETEVIATLGCKQGLLLSLVSLLDAGDEVLVEDPGFVSYEPAVHYCGGVARPVPLRQENGYRFNVDELEAAVTTKTKALILCTPHNPTGVVHSEQDLGAIARFAEAHDLVVILDETYERLTWDGRRHLTLRSLPGMRDRTVGLMGMTKSFAMGGWRIGFATAPPPLIEAMIRVQQHISTCAGSFTQHAAGRALAEPPPESLLTLWRDWQERCRHATSFLNDLDGVHCAMPEGGIYAWVDARELGEPSQAMAERLLEDHRVSVVPGSAFGPSGEGFFRVTCVKYWDELNEGLARLKAGIAASPAS